MSITSREIYIRAPLRLSLAGGGTDVEPFASQQGSSILNFAVNTMAEVKIQAMSSREKTINLSIESDGKIEPSTRFSRTIVNSMLKRVPNNTSLDIHFTNPVSSGSGLGTSSAMLIACRIGIELLVNPDLDGERLIYDTFNIERLEMGIEGGFQDYYPAFYGGCNWIVQEPGSTKRKRASVQIPRKVRELIDSKMICIALGIKRDGEKIIRDQTSRLLNRDENTQSALFSQLNLAKEIKNSIELDDVEGVLEKLDVSYLLKKKYTPLMTNSVIDGIEITLKKHGARGLKISGAGGGGHMFCFFPDGVPGDLSEKLPEHMKITNLKVSEKGWHHVDGE